MYRTTTRLDGTHSLTGHQLRNANADHVVNREQEDKERRAARIGEGAPPPVVVLVGELEVAEHDGDLCGGDDGEGEDRQQEAEHGVGLVEQHRGEHEVHLEEDGSEGHAAADDARERGVEVPRTAGNLALNVVGANGHVVLGELVADEGAEVDERERDAEPEEHESDDGGYE